jgi:peptidoglycan/xylan/chitin deacetylase (PgdA/CDA1 family)
MGILREIGKRCVFMALGSDFAIKRRLSAIRKSGKVTILNLHRVSEDDGSGYRPLKPFLFNELLNFLRLHFKFTTFSQLDEPSSKPKLILSFDDGYKDFFEVAFPLLERHRVRVNHNISPGCTEKQLPPLNVMAQDFVGKAPRELVLKLGIPGFSNVAGDRLGLRLSSFLKNKPYAEQEQLAEILIPQFFAWDGFTPTPMMSREEVRQVGQVHELGGHSYSHASMAHESNEYLREDLSRCNRYFEEILGQPMQIYAFPNGSYREEQIEIVRDSGVQHILVVGDAFADGTSPHKRFGFHAKTLSEARFKALGGWSRT